MKTAVSIYEAKAHLSKLIAVVEKGGLTVTICRHGEPVIDLVPHVKLTDPLKQDADLVGAVYRGDPCEVADLLDWPEESR